MISRNMFNSNSNKNGTPLNDEQVNNIINQPSNDQNNNQRQIKIDENVKNLNQETVTNDYVKSIQYEINNIYYNKQFFNKPNNDAVIKDALNKLKSETNDPKLELLKSNLTVAFKFNSKDNIENNYIGAIKNAIISINRRYMGTDFNLNGTDNTLTFRTTGIKNALDKLINTYDTTNNNINNNNINNNTNNTNKSWFSRNNNTATNNNTNNTKKSFFSFFTAGRKRKQKRTQKRKQKRTQKRKQKRTRKHRKHWIYNYNSRPIMV